MYNKHTQKKLDDLFYLAQETGESQLDKFHITDTLTLTQYRACLLYKDPVPDYFVRLFIDQLNDSGDGGQVISFENRNRIVSFRLNHELEITDAYILLKDIGWLVKCEEVHKGTFLELLMKQRYQKAFGGKRV